jgi:predicted metal-dependent HD superfamily phosphohydrolase
MTVTAQLLNEAEEYVKAYFEHHISSDYVFHDLEHTAQTVAAARVLAEGNNVGQEDLLLVQIAVWFHDTGYSEGSHNHEERSCNNATQFLRGKISEEDLAKVKGCIMATKVPQHPQNTLEQIIGDADLSHLGMEIYWDRTGKYRQELIVTKSNIMSEQDWVEFELDFMLKHEYHTEVAREMFNKRKAKHIQQLIKQKRRLNPAKAPSREELALLDEKDKTGKLDKALKDTEDELKVARMGRGVETMYRTTYRTHTNLSAMADSKANLMLSVNAIVISILASNLLPKLQDQFLWKLVVPTMMLTFTCLGSMVYATLATRPKITEGRVTREAIKARKANLLFFGNFYNMSLTDFQWGVNEMLKDSEFLYSSMSRDLYYLGIVLAKKYHYLSICYNIFMYGLILSVAAFAIAFTI